MGKGKKIYFGIFGIITLLVATTYFSYAIFMDREEHHGKLNIVAGTLDYRIESEALANNKITVERGQVTEFVVTITSLNEIDSKFELYYLLEEENKDVEVGYVVNTENLPSGIIEKNGSKEITVIIQNYSNTDITVEFKVIGGFIKNELILVEGYSLPLVKLEKVFTYEYTGNIQKMVAPKAGYYKLEAWGAQGGVIDAGFGGYAVGVYYLTRGESLYIYVGEAGSTKTTSAFNGGGLCSGYLSGSLYHNGFAGGGGATDIRTTMNLTYDDRIMVAGGGGGGYSGISIDSMVDYINYGYGGGGSAHAEKEINSYYSNNGAIGGTGSVINGECWAESCTGSSYTAGCTGGGGGGYVGGRGIKTKTTGPTPEWQDYAQCIAEGGTSYIGGVTSAMGIEATMIPGNESMPTYDGTGIMTGNTGNGYAKITYLED